MTYTKATTFDGNDLSNKYYVSIPEVDPRVVYNALVQLEQIDPNNYHCHPCGHTTEKTTTTKLNFVGKSVFHAEACQIKCSKENCPSRVTLVSKDLVALKVVKRIIAKITILLIKVKELQFQLEDVTELYQGSLFYRNYVLLQCGHNYVTSTKFDLLKLGVCQCPKKLRSFTIHNPVLRTISDVLTEMFKNIRFYCKSQNNPVNPYALSLPFERRPYPEIDLRIAPEQDFIEILQQLSPLPDAKFWPEMIDLTLRTLRSENFAFIELLLGDVVRRDGFSDHSKTVISLCILRKIDEYVSLSIWNHDPRLTSKAVQLFNIANFYSIDRHCQEAYIKLASRIFPSPLILTLLTEDTIFNVAKIIGPYPMVLDRLFDYPDNLCAEVYAFNHWLMVGGMNHDCRLEQYILIITKNLPSPFPKGHMIHHWFTSLIQGIKSESISLAQYPGHLLEAVSMRLLKGAGKPTMLDLMLLDIFPLLLNSIAQNKTEYTLLPWFKRCVSFAQNSSFVPLRTPQLEKVYTALKLRADALRNPKMQLELDLLWGSFIKIT